MYNLLTIIRSYYIIITKYYINFKYKIILRTQFALPSALLLVGGGVLQCTYTTSPTPPPSLVTGSDGDVRCTRTRPTDPPALNGRGMGACYRYSTARTTQAPDRPLLGGAARDYVETVSPSGTAAWWHNKKKYIYIL